MAALAIEQRTRPTIMDGKVVMFSTGFETRSGVFGESARPTGPFNVSASRNAVVVHDADIRTRQAFDALIAALHMAWNEHEALRR